MMFLEITECLSHDVLVDTFKSIVETGKPKFGTRLMLGMMGLFEPFTPKVCKSENWPFEKIDKL